MSSQSLNDNNQLVFYAKFTDGNSSIVRADLGTTKSTSVPEPTLILGILTIGALGVGLKKQNRKPIHN